MGKNKNKRKVRGQIEEDPILAKALARTEIGPDRGGTAASSSMSVKHMEIDGRSVSVMFDDEIDAGTDVGSEIPENLNEDLEQGSEGFTSGKHSEDAYQTLGDEDSSSSSGVRRNAQAKSEAIRGKSPAARDDRFMGNAKQVTQKKPFASLFEKNRLPSNGSKLEFYNLEDGPIQLGEEDIQLSAWPWERCLVGYFGGKFPGKQALNQIVASWKVHPSIQFHGSGWIIFQFGSEDDQSKVLENGPYMIYGSPLLLKQMDKYFKFGKEAISTFPVWVQMRGVLLTLWNPMVFGKICSKLGKPIHMDKLTTQKGRVTFARCLVEIDMTKELVHSIQLHTPEGIEHEQRIYYENLPRYCAHCRVVGHTKETCKGRSNPPTKAIEQVAKDQGPREAAGQITGAGTKGGGLTTMTQKEWVIKQSYPSKDIPPSEGIVPQEATKIIPDNQRNEECASEPIPE
ncbi:hypothetical protein Acr_00g0021830 [Actinidia rufa]|uniref:DUF4283 domain-containing protein n=1 Tax=Actinidia rufa TaxID=165716 RepID=A0A7J0DE53_9ERIC|nr:hypothetical protein Acr_00g0021830 [Actinidia rufa]